MDANSPAEEQAKAKLNVNPENSLNIYSALISDLGYASYPW